LSTPNIVKEKRRKSQTSQDKAGATYYHSHQTSGKNQNREYFTIHFHNFFHRLFRHNMAQRQLLLRNSKLPFKLKGICMGRDGQKWSENVGGAKSVLRPTHAGSQSALDYGRWFERMMEDAFDISENRFARGSGTPLRRPCRQSRNRADAVRQGRFDKSAPAVFGQHGIAARDIRTHLGLGPGRRHRDRPISEADSFNPR
jgi:hypothetical protein